MQIPGLTVAADQTGVLARGYWPSYNVPFYPEIYRYPCFVVPSQLKEPLPPLSFSQAHTPLRCVTLPEGTQRTN